MTEFSRCGNFAAVKIAIQHFLIWLVTTTPFWVAAIIALAFFRPIGLMIEVTLDYYVKSRVSQAQYVALRFGGNALFCFLNGFFLLYFSFSLVTLNAALQVWRIGDRDQRIQVPYKASGPLPPAVTAGQTQTEAK